VQSKTCLAVNLDEQFDRYYPAIYKYFRYRGADSDLANDLAAGVFEAALTKLTTFNPNKGAFNTWLFAIARHLAINYWKGQARRKDIAIDSFTTCSTSELMPEEVVIREQSTEMLLMAVSGLEERECEIVA